MGAYIPKDLMARLVSIRPYLERGGCVLRRKGSTGWRLRYHAPEDGIVRHKSIRLPNEQVALAVSGLISSWREEKKQRDAEIAERRRLESMKPEERWKYSMRNCIELVKKVESCIAGPSARQRRKTRRRVDMAVERGPLALISLALTPPCFRVDKGGRPRTARSLW